ncbi:LysR family transcriptional regulator [Pollutimonas bauzanensis]|uniref:DNA-binding transcriptional regulator, LysR family n=1 Tax=Pollutimonas bauzanensis TaxID=658167 RepID=A0A1M5X8S7_9BURK|nr:LysR family transcriptional regulator [Pollutimonas bauzanensis]SHH95613.1 DNA-binding transcriptional regulator, LysR family [Pollutimonas bauzanensis]HZX85927.1 LysR family transcriptional regulator [Reyranella sp.]
MINATLNQLRAFRAIVQTGSFRAAGGLLHLSQPSVSQRVRELESELGVVLFVRNGPKISLTAEGHALIGFAERMLDTSDEMAERFRSGDPLRGTLRIGLSENFALICLGELLRRVEQKYPAIKASMFIGDSGELSRKLQDRELDVAIVAQAAVPPYVSQEPVGYSQLGWFASPGLNAGPHALTPADIAQHHLVIAPQSSRMYTTVGNWFSAAGVTPARVSTCNNVMVTLQAVRSGVALGLLPIRVAEDDRLEGKVKLLKVAPRIPAHSISICHQASEAGEGLHAFIRMLKEVIADHRVFSAAAS